VLLALALLLDIGPPLPLPPPKLVGKIAVVNLQRGHVAVDLRARDGVVVGQRLRVLRNGLRVGGAEIIEVKLWGSWIRMTEGMPERGDRVEAIP
jgi:hypothetical protein